MCDLLRTADHEKHAEGAGVCDLAPQPGVDDQCFPLRVKQVAVFDQRAVLPYE